MNWCDLLIMKCIKAIPIGRTVRGILVFVKMREHAMLIIAIGKAKSVPIIITAKVPKPKIF